MKSAASRTERTRLRRLEPIVRRAMRGPCRLPPGSTLLVAVSGGADSTALLVTLASLAPELGLVLHAAHLHHGLRGREADADARFVRELCERLGTPLALARWDCTARMRRRGLSGEAGLRTLRREWLARVARANSALAVATAHTADDQLETLLMRLARGTGLSGLAGMRARRGAWLKPCLGASRAEIEADLRAHRIAWREDASNAEPTWLRNRIRHVAVPALLDALGIAPAPASARRAGLARRVATLADELARADHLLERLAVRALRAAGSDVTRTGAGSGATSVRALARWPEAVRRRALFRAWRARVGPGGPGLTSRHLQALARSVQARAGDGDGQRASIDLPGGWTFRVARGMVHFAPPEPTGGRSERDIRRSGAADARVARGRSRPGRGPTARSPARRRVPRAIA